MVGGAWLRPGIDRLGRAVTGTGGEGTLPHPDGDTMKGRTARGFGLGLIGRVLAPANAHKKGNCVLQIVFHRFDEYMIQISEFTSKFVDCFPVQRREALGCLAVLGSLNKEGRPAKITG